MPWCPKCRNEYYEGVKVCADCGCELVDSLEEPEDAAESRMREAIAAEESDEEDAGKMSSGISEEVEKTRERIARGVYQNYEEKAADNKSSAYTLLAVGAVGLLVDILCFCDILKLPFNESSKFMILGVLGAMFLFFLVMGVTSMKNAGKYAKKAESEKELTKELEKWFAEHVTAEKVDADLFLEEEADFSEEQKYFKRFDKIEKMLSERFLNLNEGYMDRFVDQHYQDIFPEG